MVSVRNGTKAEVIELVKELALSRGYAKLKADQDREKLNEQLQIENQLLRKNISDLVAKDKEIQDRIRSIMSKFEQKSNWMLTDVEQEISQL